jgi:hypothetical protein
MNVVASFQLYLAERARKMLATLQEGGIESFWYFAEGWRTVQVDRALQINQAKGIEYSKQPIAISLASHVQIVFFLLLIGLGISGACFGVEAIIGQRRANLVKPCKEKPYGKDRKYIVLESLGTLDYYIHINKRLHLN